MSIGTPPVQSSAPTGDALPSSQDKKTPIGALEILSIPSAPTVQTSSPAGGSNVMDLLDGFGPNVPPTPGRVFVNV